MPQAIFVGGGFDHRPEIFGAASISIDPGEAPLDDPATRQDAAARLAGMLLVTSTPMSEATRS
jgi:hypothetical protein